MDTEFGRRQVNEKREKSVFPEPPRRQPIVLSPQPNFGIICCIKTKSFLLRNSLYKYCTLININIGKDSTPPLGWYYPCQYNQESIYKIQKRRLRWKFSQME